MLACSFTFIEIFAFFFWKFLRSIFKVCSFREEMCVCFCQVPGSSTEMERLYIILLVFFGVWGWGTRGLVRHISRVRFRIWNYLRRYFSFFLSLAHNNQSWNDYSCHLPFWSSLTLVHPKMELPSRGLWSDCLLTQFYCLKPTCIGSKKPGPGLPGVDKCP